MPQQQGIPSLIPRSGLFSGREVVMSIVGGIITKIPYNSNYVLDGEGDLADDLDTINGGIDGDIVIIKSGEGILTVRHGVGNITLPGGINFVLANNNDMLTLQWCEDDTEWYCQSAET